MTKRIAILPLVLLLLLVAGPAMAQSNNPVTAGLVLASGEYTVGDPLILALTITHPAGSQVILPELEATWGDFTVVDQAAPVVERNGDGTETTTQTIDARLFAPGTFTTPPLTAQIADDAGQLTEVTAAPLTVEVVSVLVAGDSALRDIKPQAALPIPAIWPWIVGGLVVVGATATFVWWRRRQARRALAPVDNRSPHEVALDELARIEGLGLTQDGQFKQHYSLVADCLRLYVEQAYQLPALERTTAEIKADLRQATIDPKSARQLVLLLDAADLVKFAKVTPDTSDAQQLINDARAFVEMTKPSPAPVAVDDNQQLGGNAPKGRPFSVNGHRRTEVKA